MRKLLGSSFISLDGVVESPMTWASRFFDEECREYAHRKLDDVGTELAALKRQSGGHILKYGVTVLDRTLLEHKLVDEYDLWIMPTHVRQGKRAFADVDPGKLDLELIRTRQFRNGVMLLTYRPH